MNWIFFLISRNLFFYSLSFISPAFKTLRQAKRKKNPVLNVGKIVENKEDWGRGKKGLWVDNGFKWGRRKFGSVRIFVVVGNWKSVRNKIRHILGALKTMSWLWWSSERNADKKVGKFGRKNKFEWLLKLPSLCLSGCYYIISWIHFEYLWIQWK